MSLSSMHWGEGATRVVLLHGIGGGRQAWSENGPAIAEAGFAAVAYDLPGYGESPPVQPYDIAGLAQAVLDQLGPQPCIVVGHSMGGMVAQEMAAQAPQRVRGLVLSGTSAAFGKPGGDWQQQFLQERLAPLDRGVGMPGLAPQLVAGMVAPQAAAHAVEAAVRLMSAVPEDTYRRALVALVNFDRREALARIAVPTLAVAGEHDRNAPPAMVQRMAARIPGAEYVCVDGAGHLANLERPQAFNRLLVSFLTRHFANP